MIARPEIRQLGSQSAKEEEGDWELGLPLKFIALEALVFSALGGGHQRMMLEHVLWPNCSLSIVMKWHAWLSLTEPPTEALRHYAPCAILEKSSLEAWLRALRVLLRHYHDLMKYIPQILKHISPWRKGVTIRWAVGGGLWSLLWLLCLFNPYHARPGGSGAGVWVPTIQTRLRIAQLHMNLGRARALSPPSQSLRSDLQDTIMSFFKNIRKSICFVAEWYWFRWNSLKSIIRDEENNANLSPSNAYRGFISTNI